VKLFKILPQQKYFLDFRFHGNGQDAFLLWRNRRLAQQLNSVKAVRKEIIMTPKQIPELVGALVKNQSAFAELSTEKGQMVIREPKRAIGIFVEALNPVLEPLPEADFTLDALDGQGFSPKSQKIFFSFNFIDCEVGQLDVCRGETGRTRVKNYRLVRNANFFQMLAYFAVAKKFSELFFSPHQFLAICEHYHQANYLGGLLIPVSTEDYLVASVRVRDAGLRVGVLRFDDDCVWDGAYRPRLVVPQLIS
jgi:hypothetical protein